MNLLDIAKVCHEANRALCETQGDMSQPKWEDAPGWQVQSAMGGVVFCLSNPGAPASANHESWLKQKEVQGWKYGPVKDPEKKEHPCFVPYEQLPAEQKAKDHLFKAVCSALIPFVDLTLIEPSDDQRTIIDAQMRAI